MSEKTVVIDRQDGCNILSDLIHEINNRRKVAVDEGDMARANAYRTLLTFTFEKVDAALTKKKKRLAKEALEEAQIDNLGKF